MKWKPRKLDHNNLFYNCSSITSGQLFYQASSSNLKILVAKGAI
jgi:hypothetical protein